MVYGSKKSISTSSSYATASTTAMLATTAFAFVYSLLPSLHAICFGKAAWCQSPNLIVCVWRKMRHLEIQDNQNILIPYSYFTCPNPPNPSQGIVSIPPNNTHHCSGGNYFTTISCIVCYLDRQQYTVCCFFSKD